MYYIIQSSPYSFAILLQEMTIYHNEQLHMVGYATQR